MINLLFLLLLVPLGAGALLFVAAMVALFGGLLAFLREIFLATANLRIDPH